MSQRNRVVVTGIGLRSPIGATPRELVDALQNNRTGVVKMPQWDAVENMRCRVAGVCPENTVDASRIGREFRRSMGRIAILAALATQDAIADAGLADDFIRSAACGISYGSTAGSSTEMELFLTKFFQTRNTAGLASSSYLKFMSHTCAANLGILFQCKGPLIASCTACTSGSQGVGFGFEAIREGRATAMLTGGAEENHLINAVVFDIMFATSKNFNDRPEATPRPFDRDRDGLVVGEGAGTLLLEEYEHAKKRGAHIHAEVLGYATNCDGSHLTSPSAEGTAAVMHAALADARVSSAQIGYINAHATATPAGDIAESTAVNRVFGDQTPISGLKGYTGHTLGACGAIESIATILMMNEGFIAPTRNLENPDPKLAPLRHVIGGAREQRFGVGMNNNFAFGGVNTSLIFGRCP
jgi:3-oxoacyl-[acyl-carrier-protein] synthase II